MQKYNIAQIGTFDVENYGDLLFPIVLEAELRKRIEIEEIYLFSPKGGKMPFSNKKVYPIEDLENIINTKNIDAIIIGGGDLIRLDKNVSGDYASDFKTSIKIWEYPILVGKKHKIPVLFNAMGVPYHFAKENYHILNKIFKSVDYLCVRDNISKDILDDIDKFDCHVVPDTINAISKIYSQEELSENLQRLKKEKIIPNIKDYIVIQHKIDGIDDEYYLNKIRNLIKYITTKEDKKVLLVPIGYVHNDIKFLEKVYDKDNKNIYFIKTKLSPYDMLSVFSQAKGFIGTSLHGLLTSNVYNVPILAINCGNLVKITGYLKLIGKEKLDVKDIECLLLVYKKDFDNQKKYDDKFIIKELNQHFDEIVCKIKENTSKQIENIELDILNEMYLNIEKAIEKENYENLYKISCGKCQQLQNELDRLLNSKSWRVTKPIRNITTKIARFKQQQKNNKLKVVNEKSKKLKQIKKKIAIHIHVFYPELLDEIYYNLSQMPYDYDCFISTTSKEKKKEIVNYFKNKKMENIVVEEFENKGRDILPFILQMKKRMDNYDYICHFHTKKSKYAEYGDGWRQYLYYNLFGNYENISSIFYEFENNENLGIIYPKTYPTIEKNMEIGSCGEELNRLCEKLSIENKFNNVFPAGSMFWAKTDALLPLFKNIKATDFQEEDNQRDGTFAHAIERVLVILAQSRGYDYLQTVNNVKKGKQK